MKLIAVTSGKGGTGKSCVAAYTGVALSENGTKTLIIEQGTTCRTVDIVLAAQNDAVFDLGDVLEERCEPEKAIVATPFTDKLFLLSAGLAPYSPTTGLTMHRLIQDLSPEFDCIIIDDADFSVIPPNLFDTVLLVTTPDSLSVRACQNKARQLFEDGAEHLRLVINNVPAQVMPIHGADDFDDVINIIGVQLIAVIPQSPKLQYSSNNAKILGEESITIQVFDNLAARLRGQIRPLLIR